MKPSILVLLFYYFFPPYAYGEKCLCAYSYAGFAQQLERIREIEIKHPNLVDDYLKKLKRKSFGDQESCEHAGGIFNIQDDKGGSAQMRFNYLSGDALKIMLASGDYRHVLAVEQINKQGEQDGFQGFLVQNSFGWKWIKPKKSEPMDLPFKSNNDFLASQEPLKKKFLRIAESAANADNGGSNKDFDIVSIKFDKKMENGTVENGTKLIYDGTETIKDFGKHVDGASLSSWMDNSHTRVPPQMYELFDDESFKRAREEGRYSEVMDRIYKKATDIVGPNKVKEALFTSLLFSDLRQRGPCGAVYGLRGREGVPTSIFDGEKPSELVMNRLDAAQHFFGYALMRNLSLGRGSTVVSEVGKERQYWAPAVNEFFQRLHGDIYDYPELGANFSVVRMGTTYSGSQRTRADIEVDKLYNDLGIDFGATVNKNSSVLPSSIINSSAYDKRKTSLGLEPPNIKEWRAFDPNKEYPIARVEPPEKRRRIDVPDDIAGDLLRQRLYPDSSTKVVIYYRWACENGGDINYDPRTGKTYIVPAKGVGYGSVKFCQQYNGYMQGVIDKLYDEGTKRRSK